MRGGGLRGVGARDGALVGRADWADVAAQHESQATGQASEAFSLPTPFLLQRFSRLHQAAPTISSLPLSPRLLLKQLQLQLDEESLFQSPSKLGQQAILTPWFSVPWGEDAHQHYICIGLD